MLFFPDYRGSKMPTRDFFFTVSIPVAQRNSNPGNSAYPGNSVPGEITQIRVFEMSGPDEISQIQGIEFPQEYSF